MSKFNKIKQISFDYEAAVIAVLHQLMRDADEMNGRSTNALEVLKFVGAAEAIAAVSPPGVRAAILEMAAPLEAQAVEALRA